jgi:hypothetical protein
MHCLPSQLINFFSSDISLQEIGWSEYYKLLDFGMSDPFYESQANVVFLRLSKALQR